MLFSERKGYKKVKATIQLTEIDEATRNGLWNALQLFIWKERSSRYLSDYSNKDLKNLMQLYWHNFYRKTLDTLPDNWDAVCRSLKTNFFTCEWFELYDFMEFLINNYEHPEDYSRKIIPNLINFVNGIFEKELVGYRIVNKMITEITSQAEIEEIENAINSSNGKLFAVSKHLERALELLGDRKNPDYRNSIKESISAVESFCKIISQDEKATLGQILKELESKINLHPALKSAFNSLYGYTSDEKGIRHSLMDIPNIQFEDAKFMLTSCSSFINYLKSKAERAKIKFD